jgi:nucleoside-diphosphate-sugar epimerase
MTQANKRVLVTGASGFVGRHVCRALHGAGAKVIGWVRSTDGMHDFPFEHRYVDLTERDDVRDGVVESRVQYVIHLAAETYRGIETHKYRASYETNLLGTLNLIEGCDRLQTLKRFIFIGTCEEYGNQPGPFDESCVEAPVTAYGLSKLSATQLLRSLAMVRDFPVWILRPSVVYGPGQDRSMFLPALVGALLDGRRFAMTSGAQTRDYLYVDDLVSAIVGTFTAPRAGAYVLNISSAAPLRIEELARLAADIIGHDAQSLIDFGALEYRVGEAMHYSARNLLAQAVLNWKPRVSIEEGVRRTVEYMRQRRADGPK